jgi:predicted ATP-dependent protease
VNITKYEVPLEKLRWECDPSLFDFECTKDLAPLGEFIGQDRAIRAVEFGLSMSREGYNIFVAGITGTGKTSVVKAHIKKLVERRQKEKPFRPEDWCYLYNFTDPDRPQHLNLPQGKGKVFRDQINGLLDKLKEELAKAFSSEEYKAQRKKALEEGQGEQQRLFQEIGEEAQRQGFLLEMTAVGPAIIPVAEGKPLSQTDYLALEEPVRRGLEAKRSELLKKLQATFERVKELEAKTVEKLEQMDKSVADFTVSRLFVSLTKEYKASERIGQYLKDLKAFTLDNLDAFKRGEEQPNPVFGVPNWVLRGRDPFLPFKVNVFVDNSVTAGPPVITEPNPTYPNLFGMIERRFLFGGYLSDHTMLKPGALHLANGGYLLLGTTEVLTNPGVWPALKRSIKTKGVRIEDPYEQFGLIAPQGLRPQADASGCQDSPYWGWYVVPSTRHV